ncbi:MAG: cytochrome P450 [Alphaproteobacteria bacterium]
MTLSLRASSARPLPTLPGHVLLGNLREMAAAPHAFPAAALARNGGIVGLRVGRRRIVALGRADYARHVLVTHHETYPRGHIHRNMGAIIGDGLLATEGDLWLARRRQLQPAFRPDRLHAW